MKLKNATTNIPISIALVLMFPFIIFLRNLWIRKISTDVFLAWLMFFCGMAEKAFLMELGNEASAGNFD